MPLRGCHVCVSAQAGPWERRAAQDLAAVLQRMTGQPSPLADRPGPGVNLVVGQLALELQPALRSRLEQAARKRPVVRSDAIVLSSQGQTVYLAGNNDDSHYFAAAELMRRWGCRWYLPSPLGEHIPSRPALTQPPLNLAYSPPFEIRQIWISWNGSTQGWAEWSHRNFLNQERVPSEHALGAYTRGLANFSLVSPQSAQEVARLVEPQYGRGQSFSLSIEDQVMASRSPADQELAAGLEDKFFHALALSDNYLTFLNAVCAALLQAHPQSRAHIGFLAYVNLTLPPQRNWKAAAPLVAYLAPIDMDPNHALTDRRFPLMEDFRLALRRWCRIMDGRVVIYDYDQGMLVWRDLPEPNLAVVRANVQEYRRAGVLGFGTESRNAAATTFLNLWARAQLYWNPDLDLDAERKAFYPNFYGPAAARLESYWEQILAAWAETRVTEHEFFVIPAVYPRALVTRLGQALAGPLPPAEGGAAASPLQAPPLLQAEGGAAASPLEAPPLPPAAEPYASRVKFARLGYEVLDAYTAMLESACSQCDYAAAVRHGERGLAAREQLTAMDDSFTTYRRMPEEGPAYWPGEVELYRRLAALPQVARTPLTWSLRRDPDDHGLWQGWGEDTGSAGWESVRTDLSLQDCPLGYAWYRCQVDLPAQRPAGKLRLIFPGLFNESWLYVDGSLVDHRTQKRLWWQNDYAFRWDADPGPLAAGPHWITLRTRVPLHFAGIFRRPFFASAP